MCPPHVLSESIYSTFYQLFFLLVNCKDVISKKKTEKEYDSIENTMININMSLNDTVMASVIRSHRVQACSHLKPNGLQKISSVSHFIIFEINKI